MWHVEEDLDYSDRNIWTVLDEFDTVICQCSDSHKANLLVKDHEELEELRAANKWVPVTDERRPKELSSVLVVKERSIHKRFYNSGFPEASWRDGRGNGDGESITHWRYMPELPLERSDESFTVQNVTAGDAAQYQPNN